MATAPTAPETTVRAPFKRTLQVANFRTFSEGSFWPVFAFVQWDGSKLSITGVEGPKHNGDCYGSCGQIPMPDPGHLDRAPFYDRLAEIWDRWHLNDMRAGCEHQRAENWGAESVEVVSYKLTSEAWEQKRAAEREALRAAREGRVAALTPAGAFLIGPDWFRTIYSAPDADDVRSGLFEVEKRETKRAGWVKESEHPRGVLSKPCPTCGYKYGSAWLTEEVPTEVLAELRTMPAYEGTVPGRWDR